MALTARWMWGYGNQNDLGTSAAQNADIYQWSFGVQRLLPGDTVVSVDYSANRSTHLPWGGANLSTSNRNFIPSSIRSQFNTQTLYNDLHSNVANPFYSMFQGPNAVFNQPDSIYNNDSIPLLNLLRPIRSSMERSLDYLSWKPLPGTTRFKSDSASACRITSVSKAATPSQRKRRTPRLAETRG